MRTEALVKTAPKNNLVKWKSVLSRLLKPTMDALDHFDVSRMVMISSICSVFGEVNRGDCIGNKNDQKIAAVSWKTESAPER